MRLWFPPFLPPALILLFATDGEGIVFFIVLGGGAGLRNAILAELGGCGTIGGAALDCDTRADMGDTFIGDATLGPGRIRPEKGLF